MPCRTSHTADSADGIKISSRRRKHPHEVDHRGHGRAHVAHVPCIPRNGYTPAQHMQFSQLTAHIFVHVHLHFDFICVKRIASLYSYKIRLRTTIFPQICIWQ